MSNREKISWCVAVAFLVLLYLLSSTDLIIKEKEKEICRVSVIIDNVNDNYYGNFREGMETAEKKYQADVNFITLYAENDEEQQEDLIVREVKDGTNAIILAPVREDLAAMRLDEISPGCPVVFLGSSMISSSVTSAISVDRYEMGKTLGEQITANEDPGRLICLFTEGLSYTGMCTTACALCLTGRDFRSVSLKSVRLTHTGQPSRRRFTRKTGIFWLWAWMWEHSRTLRIS